MATLFRWLVRLIAVALVALVVGVWGVYYLASRSLPDYDDTRPIAGISAPVEIVRDTADVPHIFGKTDADVFFALGYAHAQDRLWQMVVARLTVAVAGALFFCAAAGRLRASTSVSTSMAACAGRRMG